MTDTRYGLPSGGWVEVRDPNFLRAKDRSALMRRVSPDNVEDMSKVDMGLAALNEIGALMITAWELPYEPEPNPDGTPRSWTLPKNDPSILDELLAVDAVELEKRLEPARRVLMPAPPSPDQVDDTESPSGPASE